MSTTPERSLSETLNGFGVTIRGGVSITPQNEGNLYKSNSRLQALHSQVRAGMQEFPLDDIGIQFLLDQGIGAEFILKLPVFRHDDGKNTLAFASVHPDTDVAKGELRIAMLAGRSTLWVPHKYDPYSPTLNHENVALRLSSGNTIGRGGDHTKGSVSVAEGSHILGVFASNLDSATIRGDIQSLPEEQKPHFVDSKLSSGVQGKGLVGDLSAENPDKSKTELFEDPYTLFPKVSTTNPPSSLARFHIVIADGMFDLEGNGRVRMNKTVDASSLIGLQEIAFARFILQGDRAISDFKRKLEQKKGRGW